MSCTQVLCERQVLQNYLNNEHLLTLNYSTPKATLEIRGELLNIYLFPTGLPSFKRIQILLSSKPKAINKGKTNLLLRLVCFL